MRRIALYNKWQTYKQALFLREITVTNNESSALSDFQIPIEIGGDFLNKTDPNNLIITDDNLILPYWVEQWKRPAGKSRIWTKVDLGVSVSKTLKLFYGGYFDNSPNGDNVFEFFDDFDGNSLDTNKWNPLPTHALIENSRLKFSHNDTFDETLSSVDTYGPNIICETNLSKCEPATDIQVGVQMSVSSPPPKIYAIFRQDDSKESVPKYLTEVYNSGWSLAAQDSTNRYTSAARIQITLISSGDRVKIRYISKEKGYDAITSVTNYEGYNSPHNIELRAKNFVSQNALVEFDWVFVRKYTANEPTVSIGSEQQIVRSW